MLSKGKILAKALREFSTATGGEVFDAGIEGRGWLVTAIKSDEKIGHFIKVSDEWYEKSDVRRGKVGGFPYVSWPIARFAPLEVARPISVVDLGHERYMIEADLSEYDMNGEWRND
jgi:hypothetical protein